MLYVIFVFYFKYSYCVCIVYVNDEPKNDPKNVVLMYIF